MGTVLMQASGLFVQYFPSCFCLVSQWPLEHKRLISALQEECCTRNLPGCLHVTGLCPSGTSMPVGEGRGNCAFSLCSTHKYTHTHTSVPSIKWVCFYEVLFSSFSSLFGTSPSSQHPATWPELNTRGPSLSAGDQLHSPPQASQSASSQDRSH